MRPIGATEAPWKCPAPIKYLPRHCSLPACLENCLTGMMTAFVRLQVSDYMNFGFQSCRVTSIQAVYFIQAIIGTDFGSQKLLLSNYTVSYIELLRAYWAPTSVLPIPTPSRILSLCNTFPVSPVFICGHRPIGSTSSLNKPPFSHHKPATMPPDNAEIVIDGSPQPHLISATIERPSELTDGLAMVAYIPQAARNTPYRAPPGCVAGSLGGGRKVLYFFL